MREGETPGAVVEAGGSMESDEGHSRSNFGRGKGAAATGIWQVWRERGRVRGGVARTEKDRDEAGNIRILVRRQLMPR